MKYKLCSLGWYNFEKLIQSLLKELVGNGVQSFGGSKDGGRDAIFKGKAKFPSEIDNWDGKWIFQVKFSDFEELGKASAQKSLIALFKKEVDTILTRRHSKVETIDNYILLTNIPLTGSGRDALNEIAKINYTFNFHIIDGVDACNFLDKYQQIRRSFPQLLGLADLDHIFNREYYSRANAYLIEWQEKLATFAKTTVYDLALEKLKQSHFIVLDGPPEVGKSTIGAAVSLLYLTEGFQLIDLRKSSDFYSTYEKDRKQVFIADDAIGSIAFDPTMGESWAKDISGIIRLLDSKHKLVWTARKYILEEALQTTKLTDSLEYNFEDVNEVLVEVDKYSAMEKAMILYNHSKHSKINDMSRKVIREIGVEIINSADFTPERIRQLFTQIILQYQKEEIPTEQFKKEILEFLKDPTKRWKIAYEKLSESEKQFLISLFDLNSKTTIEQLKINYENRIKGLNNNLAFSECLKRLEHSFVKRVTSIYKTEDEIDFQHPSLRDLLLQVLNNNPSIRANYLSYLTFDGLNLVLSGAKNTDEHHLRIVGQEEIDIIVSKIKLLLNEPRAFEGMQSMLTIIKNIISGNYQKNYLVILNSILEKLTDNDFYLINKEWSVSQWTSFSLDLYPILSKINSKNRPQFIESLATRMLSANYIEGLYFAGLIQKWEPVVYYREIWRKEKMVYWLEQLEQEINNCIENGKKSDNQMADHEFEEWSNEADDLIELYNKVEGNKNELIDNLISELENLIDDITIVEVEEDYDYYDDYRDKDMTTVYWTLQRIIEDI